MFARLRREVPDVTMVTATYPDITRFLELRPRSRARVEDGMSAVQRRRAERRATPRRRAARELRPSRRPRRARSSPTTASTPPRRATAQPPASSSARFDSASASASGVTTRHAASPRPDAPAIGAASRSGRSSQPAADPAAVSHGRRPRPASSRTQEADILDFADLTGDATRSTSTPSGPPAAASASRSRTGCSCSPSPSACCRSTPTAVVALRRVGDAVFKQPVKIGDTLHVEGEITRTRELDRRARARRDARCGS